MSLRINSTMRAQITHRLLAHRFDKEEKQLKCHENNLAMQVYRARYDAAERKRMDALPEGYLPVMTSVRVDGSNVYGQLHLDAPVRVPYVDHCNRVNLRKLKNADELTAKVAEHFKASHALEKKREELRGETSRAIAGFGTVSRLVEGWPQVKPFIGQLGYDIEKKALPAVIPAELNTSLGL